MAGIYHAEYPLLDGAEVKTDEPVGSLLIAPLYAQLGMGFDERTGASFDLAVTGDIIPRRLRPTWKTAVSIDYVDSYEKLDKFFSMKASARYSGASGGASASVEAVKSSYLTRSSILIAVRVRILKRLERLVTTKLLPSPKKLLREVGDKKLHIYAQRYGGSFVRTIYSGAELACTIEISTLENEHIEELRKKASMHGFGASGNIEVLNSLTEFSRGRGFKLRAWQTGGDASRNRNDGLVNPTTPDDLIARVSTFIKEMQRKDAQVDALTMELSPMTQIGDWPTNVFRDPRTPYPSAIETIAENVNRIRAYKDEVDAVIETPNAIGPSAMAMDAAEEFQRFLNSTLSIASRRLSYLMSASTKEISCYLETFPQYRLRQMLKVTAGAHENVAPFWDATTTDIDEYDTFFGPRLIPIKPWPEYKWKQEWGYHGEDKNLMSGPWLRCHPKEHHTMLDDLLANNPDYGKSGRLVFGTESPHSEIWGKALQNHNTACNYNPLVVTTIWIEEPDRPLLPTLPKDVGTISIDVSSPSLHLPLPIGPGIWRLAFDIELGDIGTVGRFDLEIKEILRSSSANPTDRTVRANSYWYKPRGGVQVLTYSHECQDGWSVVSFDVVVRDVYELSPEWLLSVEA